MKLPELLAPVNGPEGLEAALAGGADAVYCGLTAFNARQMAKNFDLDTLEHAVRDCHRAGCKLYLTFNTLVRDDEWPQAGALLVAAWERGIDALIVQDLGIIDWVHRRLPDLPLHASTQMTVHHPAQLEWLARAGVERIILARELSLSEVETMQQRAEQFGMGVEVFVHGALCVSYSGQCLISALIEGRSGNRGLCAQICRRPFSLAAGKQPLPSGERRRPHSPRRSRRGAGAAKGPQKSLSLSMKDLAALPLLPDLVRIGVSALKIEGRLKRPEYVAEVTAVYKQALGRIESGRSGAFSDLQARLEAVFNRGFCLGGLGREFTAGQTTGRRRGARFPRVGTVTGVDRRRARIFVRVEKEPAPGDGVALFPPGGESPFALVVTRLFPGRPDEGQWIGVKPFDGRMQNCPERGDLMLSSNAAELARIRASITTYEVPSIPISVVLDGGSGAPLQARATARCGWTSETSSSQNLQPAAGRPLTEKTLRDHFGRLGQTAYSLESLRWEGPKAVFLPLSELNAMRRRLIDGLENKRRARRPRPSPSNALTVELAETRGTSAGKRWDTKLAVLCPWNGAETAARAGAARIYCPADEAPPDEIPGLQSGQKPWLQIPAITSGSLYAKIESWFSKHAAGLGGVLIGHLGAADLALREGLPFWADASLNVVNRRALDHLSRFGAAGATLSWEVEPEAIADLAGHALPTEAVVFGRPPVLHTALRLVTAKSSTQRLVDEAGRSYPLRYWPDQRGCTIEAPFFRQGLGAVAALKGRIAFLRLDLREIDPVNYEIVLDTFQGVLDGSIDRTEARGRLREWIPSRAESKWSTEFETTPRMSRNNDDT